MGKILELEKAFEKLKESAAKINEEKNSIFLTSYIRKQAEIKEKIKNAMKNAEDQLMKAAYNEEEIKRQEQNQPKKKKKLYKVVLYWIMMGMLVSVGWYGMITGIATRNMEDIIYGTLFAGICTPIIIYKIWKKFSIKSKLKNVKEFNNTYSKTVDKTYEQMVEVVGEDEEDTARMLMKWEIQDIGVENFYKVENQQYNECLKIINENRIQNAIEKIAKRQTCDIPSDFKEVHKQKYIDYENAKNNYMKICNELGLQKELRTAAAMEALFSYRKEKQNIEEEELLKDFIKKYFFAIKPFSQLEKEVFSIEKYAKYKEDKEVYTSKVGVAIFDYMNLPASQQKQEWIFEQ